MCDSYVIISFSLVAITVIINLEGGACQAYPEFGFSKDSYSFPGQGI